MDDKILNKISRYQYNNNKKNLGPFLIKPLRGGCSYPENNFAIQRKSDYPYCHVHVVTESSCTFTVNDEIYYLSEGDVFFVFPGQQHSYFAGDRVGFLWVELDFSGFVGFLDLLENKHVIKSENTGEIVKQLVELLYSLKQNMVDEFILSGMCYMLMMHIFNAVGLESKGEIGAKILQVKNYINDNFVNDFTVDDIAEKFNISKSYLVKKFKAETGSTIGHYVIMKKLELAVNLLKNTDKTCDEISSQVGFYDASHLNKLCLKHLNMTPTQIKGEKNKYYDLFRNDYADN